MSSPRDTMASLGLLGLRVGIGGMMLVHGIAKVQGFDNLAATFPDPIGVGSKTSLMLAIGAEVGCSVLLIIGLLTRLATIPLGATMVVALFVVHKNDPWNVKELAAVYLLVYAVLLLTGPGCCSLDHLFWSKRAKPEEKQPSSK